ncbi:MAG: peptidoglycan DD-metalloendopeptidase family protein [Legionellales bacterium]|nr:peptidoglycan DD-metalloendopeptidase family protein [Legionellales bacterium]
MRVLAYGCCLFVALFFLSACGEREGLAPVVESNWLSANAHAVKHIVVRGETLYSIAFRYDKDYRQLAILNHLNSPYTLHVGQLLRLDVGRYPRSPRQDQQRRTPKPMPHPPSRSEEPIPYANTRWLWPLHGHVVASYAPAEGRKGIDIAGRRGEKIYATSSGVVAYAGTGLSGYGNLIIVKHDLHFLTAYGNNSRNLVQEGQRVKAGQAIAEIGSINRHVLGVHFEIRRDGKPVNPLNYLKKG